MTTSAGERRLLIEPFDPRVPMVGGVDTCIRGLVKFAPDDMSLAIVGLDVVGDATLGEWMKVELDGRTVMFMPVYRGDNAVIRPRVPHVINLTFGVLKNLRAFRRFDTIQTHRVSLGFVARLFLGRRPHVQFVHNDGADSLSVGTESYFAKAKWAFRLFEALSVKSSREVVVFNREATARLSAHGSNVHFSPTWYDDDRFFPAADDAPVRTRTNFVWLARFEPPKDPLLAVETMAHTPEGMHLTMMGTGSLLSDAQQRAEELGVSDRITFAGIVKKEEVGQVLRGYDGLLMTSFHEGFPRAVVESLASGLPVATTAGGEPNGLVQEHVNGARSDDRRPESLAAALERLSALDAQACRESVVDLSASKLVPVVLGASARPAQEATP